MNFLNILGAYALFVKAVMPYLVRHTEKMMKSSKIVLAENLERLMEFHKIPSDAALAKMCRPKVDQKTIWRIRNKSQSPTIEKLEAIAAALGLRAWQLLTPGFDPANPPTITITASEANLYKKLSELARDLPKTPH